MQGLALFFVATALIGLLTTIFYMQKRIDLQNQIFRNYIESMHDDQLKMCQQITKLTQEISSAMYGHVNMWNEIDVLQKQVEFLEKGQVYDPKVSHE
jgi:hypothetical protein